MFSSANTPTFTLTLDGVAQDFQVLAFDGREAIGQPYRFQLELVSERPDWPLEALLQRPAFLAWVRVTRASTASSPPWAQGDTGRRLTRYRAELVPRLAALAHRVNSRILPGTQRARDPGAAARGARHPRRRLSLRPGANALSAARLLRAVRRKRSGLSHPPLREEGLHFHHQHRRDGHVLVFGDDATGFARLGATRYRPGSGLVTDEPVISRLAVGLQIRSSAATLRDHDPLQPRLRLHSNADAAAQPALEDYGFPGRFTDRATGQRLSSRRLERLRGDAVQAEGASDQPSLVSGHFLPLEQHPRADWNQLWLLTEIQHQGRQPQVLEEDATDAIPADGWRQGYRNSFVARPWTQPFRLPLRHPKPRLLGAQSAVVTGPAGDDIHCDALGRIKVQFHWDRQGRADERTSCWLRVASGWAG